ncbi:MAG TPA: hypothetical protein DCZ63_09675 [Geobacter sp.]|nr:MAG: hypothetical protein A2X48_00780 [Lentisphaerae bacterium GWF2_49_21]HBA72429.1 hypothetical protein [Geobacter sp.]
MLEDQPMYPSQSFVKYGLRREVRKLSVKQRVLLYLLLHRDLRKYSTSALMAREKVLKIKNIKKEKCL